MPRVSMLAALPATAVLIAGTAACAASPSEQDGGGSAGWKPVTIEHALGTTTIESEPKRVATVNWANHEVPLALGVVPVGMASADFGDDNGDGVLPWVEDELKELDAETPVLFDETDGIDFEAVADTEPDVILAAYSGLTKEDYETLSEIAPVVAYPETAWGTPWREMIEVNSKALGKAEEGRKLISDLEKEIGTSVGEHPRLADRSVMFLTHVDTTDLSEISFYTSHDTRAMFFEDLGMRTPKSVAALSKDSSKFSLTHSAERADEFDDVDVIVTYGDEKLVEALEDDPLLSQMPAVENGAIVPLPGDGPIGTAANPTPLAISWVLDDYLSLLEKAVGDA